MKKIRYSQPYIDKSDIKNVSISLKSLDISDGPITYEELVKKFYSDEIPKQEKNQNGDNLESNTGEDNSKNKTDENNLKN